MKHVLKEVFDPSNVGNHVCISMRMGAQLLHFENQRGVPCLWYMQDMDAPNETRTFVLHVTGFGFGEDLDYIGTTMILNGDYVLHLFEVNKP